MNERMTEREIIEQLEYYALNMKTAPSFDEMRRRTLVDKGAGGATSAHVIEEIHTPLNIAYVTFTTGTTAFQNIVGVVETEIPGRISAAKRLFELAEVNSGDKMLVTYPPLVNVFSRDALESCGITWDFLDNSSRDAFLLALIKQKPRVIIGESSFIRAALIDSERLGIVKYLPENMIILAAGTPLDLELPSVAKSLVNAETHDLYGCQEFGWITLNGIPLRNDISLVETDDGNYVDVYVGGLPTSDRFLQSDTGHVCDSRGKIITYKRQRLDFEPCVYIEEITANSRETAVRLAKTILRVKGRLVRVSDNLKLSGDKNVVTVRSENGDTLLSEIDKTDLLTALLTAQLDYQAGAKKDSVWIKTR